MHKPVPPWSGAFSSCGCLTLTRAISGQYTDAVDIYNSATGTWSTARLSGARADLGAASVGNLAIFAGGREHTADFRDNFLDVVDIYNSATGTWSTARLSASRMMLSGVSAGNTVIFAGGVGAGGFLAADVGIAADLYNTATGTWSTAELSAARFFVAATSFGNLAIFAGGENHPPSNVVDIYNSATGTWSTAQLSVGRKYLAAASAGNLAIIAGGFTGAFSH
jgi:hypothetical protein